MNTSRAIELLLNTNSKSSSAWGKRVPLFLEVVNYEESVEVVNGKPLEGSETAHLVLKTPDGSVVKAEIPHKELGPLLAKMWPEDIGYEQGEIVDLKAGVHHD
jgi:hypothetical protein